MDFQAMMKQAQLVQQKLHEAQNKMSESVASGVAGAGLVALGATLLEQGRAIVRGRLGESRA